MSLTRAFALFVFALSGIVASNAIGANQVWDNGAANFLWNNKGTAKNWDSGKAWVNGNDAIFGTTGVGTVKVDASGTGGTSANSITINAAGYTFTQNLGTDSLTLVVSGLITANQDVSMSVPLGGSVGLTKAATATLTLSGASSYSGVTTINAGTLKLDNNNTTTARLVNTSGITIGSAGTLLFSQSGATSSNDRVNNAALITLSGGTLNTGGLNEIGGTLASPTAGMGALTLTATSKIDFGTGTSSVIEFGGVGSHTASTILQLTNWSGIPQTGGGTDRLLFAGTALSFTSVYNQADVTFNGVSGYVVDQFSGYFEVTAVPEPSTWFAATLSLAAIGFTQRRRFLRLAKRAG